MDTGHSTRCSLWVPRTSVPVPPPYCFRMSVGALESTGACCQVPAPPCTASHWPYMEEAPWPLGQPEASLCSSSAHYMTTPLGPRQHISSDKEIRPCSETLLLDGSCQLMSLAKGQSYQVHGAGSRQRRKFKGERNINISSASFSIGISL